MLSPKTICIYSHGYTVGILEHYDFRDKILRNRIAMEKNFCIQHFPPKLRIFSYTEMVAASCTREALWLSNRRRTRPNGTSRSIATCGLQTWSWTGPERRCQTGTSCCWKSSSEHPARIAGRYQGPCTWTETHLMESRLYSVYLQLGDLCGGPQSQWRSPPQMVALTSLVVDVIGDWSVLLIIPITYGDDFFSMTTSPCLTATLAAVTVKVIPIVIAVVVFCYYRYQFVQ